MWNKASKFDIVYRKLLLTKFFTKGWGKPDTLKSIFELGRILSDRSVCQELVDDNYPITIDKDEEHRGCRIIMGHFHSPFANLLPNIMPPEVQTARFQMVLPQVWPRRGKPVCIHLAGTGDHHFWRRRVQLARPLIKEYGIGSLLLENPYYGNRKPKDQVHSSLQNVSDLFVMGGALILESLTLLHWCEKQGLGPLALSGVSMGGHMATLAATNWPKPIPLIPCLSWSSATPVFTHGVMSGSLPWNLLATQYVCHHEYEADILKKLLKCPHTDAFKLGQEFAFNFPESAEKLHNVQFRKGLAKLHKDDKQHTMNASTDTKNASSTDVIKQKCNKKPVTNTVDDLSTERTMEDQAIMCNNETTTNPANFSTSINSAIGVQSVGATGGYVDDTPSVPQPSVLIREHSQSESDGMVQHSHPQVLKVKDTVTDKVLLDSDKLGFMTNPRGDVSPQKRDLHQNSSTRSKFDDEFLKETSNIPVADSLASEPKLKKLHFSVPHVFPNIKEQLLSRNTETRGQQKSKVMRRKDIKKIELVSVKEEAMEFMQGVMDVSTFVGNFSTPVDPSLIIVIAAEKDGYMPRDKMPSLQDLWPEIEVRYLNSGHVRAILFMQDHFRKAINDAITKYMIKYPDEY